VERAELTRRIRKKAWSIGFNAVGISRAEPVKGNHLHQWLERQFHGQMGYMARNLHKRADPAQVLPGVQSILCVALNYLHPYPLPYDVPEKGVISRYASGKDYHQVVKDKLESLLKFTQELDPQIKGKVYVDTGPMMDKYWAVRSGLGWLGKHTNVLSKEAGSWFFLGEILLDVELDSDVPGADFCGSCTRCIDACPTDAIVEPYVLDSRRCISYLTIELQEDIPEQLREGMGNLIFGCDICQDVCPWNRKAPESAVEEFEPKEINQAPGLQELARLSREDFQKRYKDSPIARSKWRGFIRNVVVAIGNSGQSSMIPELKGLLNTEDAMVRRHVKWALEKLQR